MLERRRRDVIDEIRARLSQGESNFLERAFLWITWWVRAPLRELWGFKRACLLGCIASVLFLGWAFIHGGSASFSLRQHVHQIVFPFVVIFAWSLVADIGWALRQLRERAGAE